MSKVYNINASVHKPLGEGFRVKAELPDIGLYINGMVVYPPNNKHEDWQVYTPANKYGFKYVHFIEFNTKLPLWQELCEVCINAVKIYQNTVGGNDGQDVVLEDIDDGPIDLSSIPF